MGLLDGTTQSSYYQGGKKGGYQFTSLEDIINQFMVVYVGEDKIIPKAKRLDVAFHAQRAMQELSFDTFKSVKSQEITIPPSSVMILPHDYVNYTDVSWVDSGGVKIPLYPTSNTSNPTSLMQDDSGGYFFQGDEDLVKNGDFSGNLDSTTNWNYSNVKTQATAIGPFTYSSNQFPPQIISFDDATCDYSSGTTVTHDDDDGRIKVGMTVTGTDIPVGAVVDSITSNTQFELSESTTGSATDETLTFASPSWNYALTTNLRSTSNQGSSNEDSIKIENGALAVTTMNYLWNGYRNTDVASHCYAVWQQIDVSSFNVLDISAIATSHASTAICGNGIIKFGLSTEPGSNAVNPFNRSDPTPHQKNVNPAYIPGGYLEWNDGSAVATEKTLAGIDVTTYDTLYVVMSFRTIWSQMGGGTGSDYIQTNTIDDVSVRFTGEPNSLRLRERSSTWDSYKSNTSTENQNQHNDDTYWPIEGSRFGLDPQHTQANGSFYIDNLKGLVHFSSNIPGKTVILDYISDSLGTDGEMQVHKFAEEAMYRWILHAIAAGRMQTQQLVPRLKKEKTAAIRQAKLRLSNIKLEELTQILRGKSKHIKH